MRVCSLQCFWTTSSHLFLAHPNWMGCYHPTIKVKNPRQVPCTLSLLLKTRSRCSVPGMPDTRPEWYRLEVSGISPDVLRLVWCTLLNRWQLKTGILCVRIAHIPPGMAPADLRLQSQSALLPETCTLSKLQYMFWWLQNCLLRWQFYWAVLSTSDPLY